MIADYYASLCPILSGAFMLLGFAATTKADLTEPRKPATAGSLVVGALIALALIAAGLISWPLSP